MFSIRQIDGLDPITLDVFRVLVLTDSGTYIHYHYPFLRGPVTCCECGDCISRPEPQPSQVDRAAYHRDLKYLFVCDDCLYCPRLKTRGFGRGNGPAVAAEIQYHGSRFTQGEW